MRLPEDVADAPEQGLEVKWHPFGPGPVIASGLGALRGVTSRTLRRQALTVRDNGRSGTDEATGLAGLVGRCVMSRRLSWAAAVGVKGGAAAEFGGGGAGLEAKPTSGGTRTVVSVGQVTWAVTGSPHFTTVIINASPRPVGWTGLRTLPVAPRQSLVGSAHSRGRGGNT